MMRSMRKQESIREMTDRELRAYKRKLRIRRERRRKMLSLVTAVCLALVCVIFCHSLTSRADGGGDASLKYYTGIIVKDGDSLWSIADQYIDYEQYSGREEYIEEVCSINRLKDASAIHVGQRLVVPYYSSEYRD